MLDRESDGAAELIAVQAVLSGGEVVASVEVSVTDELEEISVNLIGARFGDYVYDRAGVKSVAS